MKLAVPGFFGKFYLTEVDDWLFAWSGTLIKSKKIMDPLNLSVVILSS